jgi:hypothetical protein
MQRIFEVLFDQLDTLKTIDNPGLRPASSHLAELNKLPSYLLRHVFEGYSVNALQVMAQGRCMDPHRKRASLEQDLANHFYDVPPLKQALERLSPIAREGFYHIKRAGGLISLGNWRMQIESRYGKEDTDQAQAELVGGLLAFYGNRNPYGMGFSFQHKSELASCGGVGPQIYFWSHSKVLNLFKVSQEEEAKYLARDLPQTFKGAEPVPALAPGFDSLLADLVSTTRYFEQTQVKALVSGGPGKRDFTKINGGLSVKEPGDIKTVKKIEDLGRLYFLWTLLKETQLVSLKVPEEVFQANHAASEEFFNMPRYRQARLLAGAWLRSDFNEFKRIPSLKFYRTSYYESSIPDTSKNIQARRFVLGLLDYYRRQGSLRPGEWLDFSSMVRAIQDLDANFLINHDFSGGDPGTGVYYRYDYDPLYPIPGFYGEDYYAGFTSTLKTPAPAKVNYRLPGEIGAPLKLAEDFALVEGEWLAQVLGEPLSWLGLVELARDEKGRPQALRLTDLGFAALADQPSERELQQAAHLDQLAAHSPETTRALLVQPNFDVLVLAPLENLPLLRQVDRFASQTSMGDVALYHISKDSVLRGLRSGLRGSDIVQTLRENNRVTVASNVVQTIEDWSTEFDRLILHENTHLLETPDAATLDRLMSQPDVHRFVVRRLGSTFALVTGELAQPAFSTKAAKLQAKPPARSNAAPFPLYQDYQALRPGSVSLENTTLLKVQPDAGNPYLFYQLGQFADLETWDKTRLSATFRLSAAAGQRAQQNGLTYQGVAEFLNEVLPRPTSRNRYQADQIPPETALALKGWLGFYGPVQVEKVLAIRVGQAGQLVEIFGLEEFKPALLGWAGPNIALVKESHFEELAARLAELGMPILDAATPVIATPEIPAGIAEKPKKGRRTVSEETSAERERKAREREEAGRLERPDLLSRQVYPVSGSRSPRKEPELSAIMDLLDLMAGTGVEPAELERMLDDLEGDDGFLPVRPRRKKE